MRTFKVKGVQNVEVAWQNFTGSNVSITRNSSTIAASTPNDGSYTDNIGVKGGGQSYTYEVCETVVTTNCASATANF